VIDTSDLPFVETSLAYLGDGPGHFRFEIHPPSTRTPCKEPPKVRHAARIHDCRPISATLDLDRDGSVLVTAGTSFADFLDPDAVRAQYDPEVETLVRELTGALAVMAFDHNVRTTAGAARGQKGVRAPVDCVHGDYTEASGGRRLAELLESRGLGELRSRRASFVNVWRPIRGPVVDLPLAVCLPETVEEADLVPTAIEHYGEGGAPMSERAGEIYCVRHRPGHRWLYVAAMAASEALVFKTYDTRRDVSRFILHTGFADPTCPASFTPRESIETRLLVIHAERRS
jgi:hypothetical protein